MAEASPTQRSWGGQSPSSPAFKKSQSSGTLQKSGLAITGGPGDTQEVRIPKHLSTTGLTRRRKLSASTGNIHGYMAEDYSQIYWPLPKSFGKEKYGYSLIDIEDKRYVRECASMSKRLIRLSYDQQIIDLEWRKTYKALLDAEHRYATVGENCTDQRKAVIKHEVDKHLKYLLELQEQKDMYEDGVKDIYSKCDSIKATIKKESDLEELREQMEKRQKETYGNENVFWRTKFSIRSSKPASNRAGADFGR